VTTITQPADLGPFEDATPCRVLFLRRHAIFGGTTGSGKSGGLNVLMGNLTACPDVIIWAIDLKNGMELGPWRECIDRLATTPGQAAALLRDAAAILGARGRYLAAGGRRSWEPSAEMPALVIIIDEYAELAEQAPRAMSDTDSIARLGRALAVTLVAATQRPTQKAMGQGAVRSQMDLRICFRVREQRDVDLVLGQGMLRAGWNAHKLNAPGKFLISAPEYDIPRAARAYLVTDQVVRETSARHARIPRRLDYISRTAIVTSQSDMPSRTAPPIVLTGTVIPASAPDPDTILKNALYAAPPEGIPVSALITATGMSRRWVFYRLQQLAADGHAVQTVRGHWRATR
jgi:FtsK/SpoIIIE family